MTNNQEEQNPENQLEAQANSESDQYVNGFMGGGNTDEGEEDEEQGDDGYQESSNYDPNESMYQMIAEAISMFFHAKGINKLMDIWVAGRPIEHIKNDIKHWEDYIKGKNAYDESWDRYIKTAKSYVDLYYNGSQIPKPVQDALAKGLAEFFKIKLQNTNSPFLKIIMPLGLYLGGLGMNMINFKDSLERPESPSTEGKPIYQEVEVVESNPLNQ
jgi:hypothetical protein